MENKNLLPALLENTYPIIMKFRETYYRKEREKWTTKELFYLPELNKWYKFPALLKRLKNLGQDYNMWECRWIFHKDYSYIGTHEWSYDVVNYRIPHKQKHTKEYIRKELLKDPNIDFSKIFLLREDLINDYNTSRIGNICFDYDFLKVPDILSSPREKFTLIHNVSGKVKEYTTDYFSLIVEKKDARAVMGIKLNKARALTKEEFISKARRVHGDKYDYSEVEYVNNRIKVKIWCKSCQEFFYQDPSSHLYGRGCPKCAQFSRENKNRKTTEEFIEEAQAIHGDKYDYSKIDYINYDTPLKIICNECGSEFLQAPSVHLAGSGCPNCARKLRGEHESVSNDEFLKRAKQKHGDRFEYLDKYYRSESLIRIRCKEHDRIFTQTPIGHLNSQLCCPDCRLESYREAKCISKNEFILKAIEAHGIGEYDYSEIDYVDYETPIKIFDPLLKEYFWQKPHNHCEGHGNPHRVGSKGERLVSRWLKENNIEENRSEKYIKDIKRTVSGVIIDFVIEYNNSVVWIEYNGIQHYRADINFYGRSKEEFEIQLNRDRQIREYCSKNNIKLIEIPYTIGSYRKISEFLNRTIIEGEDPNTIIDYKSLYEYEM